VCVDGNTTALSDSAGQLVDPLSHGVLVDDRRVLRLFTVQLGEGPSASVASASAGNRSEFLASARQLGTPGPDPSVEMRRRRVVHASTMTEELAVISRGLEPVRADLVLRLAGDGASVGAIKAGISDTALLASAAGDAQLQWQDEWHSTTVSFDPAPDVLHAGTAVEPARATFALTIPPGGTALVRVHMAVRRRRRSEFDADAGSDLVDWDGITVEATDPRLQPTVHAAFDDLRHLLLTDPDAGTDVFAAAGTPWYLTLFGRDALWTARMMLPFGTQLAGGTLRALARRQGKRHDDQRAEAPGKIPHELRRAPYVDPLSGLSLPPVYYGTIDATALWVIVLHDAWRWGMPAAEVQDLLPCLQESVRWLLNEAAPDPDGLLKYLDVTGSGLANQGWKDSDDAIRWRDGRIAEGPIALVEAQAYAVEAVQSAAALYDAVNLPGAAELRHWAEAMRERVRNRFWVRDHVHHSERYLGLAVDGRGDAVDGVGSNMGHVLGTTTLSAAESVDVVRRMMGPQLLGAYGIATLASDNGGYNPIGYHTGSIWTHDTAIAAWGMAREGHTPQAVEVALSLLASAAAFHYRWPELYAGQGVLERPAPYPASCRPQAWSAASAAVLLSVALGFEPDAPAGRLTLRPSRPAAFGAMTVQGLRFAGHEFTVRCAADGSTEILDAPPHVKVTIV
jgi:glycogen debranching enzyme